MKSTLNNHWKDWCWSFNTLATWCKRKGHWKKPWCWEKLKAEGEECGRGWGGWMASPIQWTWTWASSGKWWGTEKPGVLQSMGSKRTGHDLVTEKQLPSLIDKPIINLFGHQSSPWLIISVWRWTSWICILHCYCLAAKSCPTFCVPLD